MPIDATDTPGDGLQYEDTPSDGIGASANEVVVNEDSEEQEEVDYSTDPLGYLQTRDDIPEDVKGALSKGFLRQSDYTRKTQAIASERRRLDDQRSVVDQIILEKSEAKKAKEEEKAPPPDLARGAKPEDVILYYVNKQVEARLAEIGLNEKLTSLEPMAQQQKVVSSYQRFAKENPAIDHATMAAEVGRILDTDPDLSDLAEVNPDRAVRLAAKMAQSSRKVAKNTAKSKKRKEAAPVASRQGSVVRKGRRESPLEAATRALKEQGVNFGN
ncbi:hypothetical protein CMI37_36205 [Candidatus Pacearchaeota archaeon]|jgi:hypothetical protein|nr:hypothetical protein [Candidatus Pacearchaeota archaeon]|tara:strand:- start:10474 stop:11289 length:816 start_codon:yes stop_codon:yes gene_type:complete